MMKWFIKNTLRALIVYAPLWLTYKGITHILSCSVGDIHACGACIISTIWLATVILVILTIIMVNFENIWNWIWND